MPAISSNDLKCLDTLSKEYRIVFAGELQPEEWPECHRSLMGDVAKLGATNFCSYTIEPTIADTSPWKTEMKQLARSLADRAKRNRHRNESSWRMSCEPYIFARLSGEVVCNNCRKRVWRSEIEASCDTGSRRGLALHERRKTREPCRCPRMARSHDHLEAIGLNPIFGHREDETVRHDPIIAKRLGKRIQRPDAVFGLRQTRNIENLLHDTRKRKFGQVDALQLHEELQPSPIDQPLDQNGDELLYPFLVLEAKSGTSECDWHSIQLQTAFLFVLFLTRNIGCERHLSPRNLNQFRWFGFLRTEAKTGVFQWLTWAKVDIDAMPSVIQTMQIIVDVWRGSILTLDGALQLLLLVDYVFDWARDIYREDVIRKLRVLASGENDTASMVYTDTDIFSTRPVDQPELHSSTAEDEDYQAYMLAQSSFVANDPSELDGIAVRHATFVDSRYCCVFATRDNIATMLQSTNNNSRQRICRKILKRMPNAMLLDQSTLIAMEERWTGTVRMSLAPPASEGKYYTLISCTNYLSADWHQIRELHVIALAEDAWDALVEGSSLQANRKNTRCPPFAVGVDVEALLKNINRLQANTPGDTLLACITRRAVELNLCLSSDCNQPVNTTLPGVSAHHIPPVATAEPVDSDGILREIVHYMYSSFKKGSFEPQESFLKTSRRLSQQHLISPDEQSFYAPETPCETLQPSQDGCVLIRGKSYHNSPERTPSEMCLYLVNGDPVMPTEQEIRERTKRVFETRDVYFTLHDNGTSNLTSLSRGAPRGACWNLQDTYGIVSSHSILRDFVSKADAPSRQGSPRFADGADSGAYLHKRTLVAWSDPRRSGEETRVRLFLIYKIVSREIRYWREVAALRNAEGIWACAWCAGTGRAADEQSDICHECSAASSRRDIVSGEEHDVMLDWVRNCFMGKPPFPVVEETTVDDDEDYGLRWAAIVPSSNHQWNRALSGYPALELPFENMEELLFLCDEFYFWRPGIRSKHRRRRFAGRDKRRKVEAGSQSQHVGQEDSGSGQPNDGLSLPRQFIDLT